MLQFLTSLLVIHIVFGANLLEVLQANGNSKLIKYASACGLADTLMKGSFTIFAPTDAAFDTLGTEQELLADTDALASLLLYHIREGVLRSIDTKNEQVVDTMTGQKIRFNIYSHNQAVTIEGAKISKFDLTASNGIVHVIDKVMLPSNGNIVQLVAGNKNLTTLLSLVSKVRDLTSKLQADPLTIFAPTNAAFASLSSHTLHVLNNDVGLLEELLEYHVVPHTEYSSGLYNREYLRTLDRHNDRIRLGNSGHGVIVNFIAKVVQADLSASNGVVHMIDHVLIPLRLYHNLGIKYSYVFGK